MPNIENIEKVKAAILHDPRLAFDMSSWFDSDEDCGTVACIGGTACFLKNPEYPSYHALDACEYLGIPEELGRRLFFPSPDDSLVDEGFSNNDFWHVVTADHAVAALDLVAQGATADEITTYWTKLSLELLAD